MGRIGAATATLVAGLVAGLVGAIAATLATPVGAQSSAEQQLAERYAPTVVVRRQDRECDRSREGLRPVPVDVVLGRDDVVLRDRSGEIVARAPTAADLAGKDKDHWLDLPGNALKPGCDYDKWFRRIAGDVPTTVYAHVRAETGEPGRLALQYWFYWIFNDWNDEHESDWEMIQLVFEADSAEEALGKEPVEAGFAQHQGAQRADWDGGHLLREDGTHPLVYAGNGSHSSHFRSALFLGHSGANGFGCDDTTTPSRAERAQVIVLPTFPGPDRKDLAWLSYEGRWGERQRGPNNGPTGPNMKNQWLEPITWAEDTWRDGAVTVPDQAALGSSTTRFACKAMEELSGLYITYVQTPWLVLGGFLALPVAAVVLARRTRWSPVSVAPVDQRRRSGQVLRSALRLYRHHVGLFVSIGAMAVPLGALFSLVQLLVFRVTGLHIVIDVARSDVLVGLFGALLAGGLGTTLAMGLVYAGCAVAVDQLAAGRRPSVGEVLRSLRARWRPVLGLVFWLTAVSAVLAVTVIGIPFAVVYLVRRLPAFPACVLEALGAREAVRRSRMLVKGRTGRVAVFTFVLHLLTTALGPLVALVVLLAWSPSLNLVNLIGGLLYTVALPFAGIAFVLLFYDLRQRRAAAEAAVESEAEGAVVGRPPGAPVPAEV